MLSTAGRGLLDITREVSAVVSDSRILEGTCTVFLRHTSASLVIQENASPAVQRDLQRWIEFAAPEVPPFGRWEHDDEGPDDMPGHARASLLKTSEVVPVVGGRLALGTWQAIYLWEHRTGSQRRTVHLTVMGEE
ncbi:MAG: secondary thiamine-phosphate synthase enzyme YjbQ [Polyangiales bacterium]